MNYFGEINKDARVDMSASEFVLLIERVLKEERREIARVVEQEVRKAILELQDRQSFVAANDWLSHEQVEELLGRSRSYVATRRKMRKLAKTDAGKDAAFPPTYQEKVGARVRFKRSEIEAWQRSYMR